MHPRWGDAKKSSIKRRVRRCLNIFDDAGYVSWYRGGRTTVYEAEGLRQLRIPGDEEWNQATISLMGGDINNRGTEMDGEITE